MDARGIRTHRSARRFPLPARLEITHCQGGVSQAGIIQVRLKQPNGAVNGAGAEVWRHVDDPVLVTPGKIEPQATGILCEVVKVSLGFIPSRTCAEKAAEIFLSKQADRKGVRAIFRGNGRSPFREADLHAANLQDFTFGAGCLEISPGLDGPFRKSNPAFGRRTRPVGTCHSLRKNRLYFLGACTCQTGVVATVASCAVVFGVAARMITGCLHANVMAHGRHFLPHGGEFTAKLKHFRVGGACFRVMRERGREKGGSQKQCPAECRIHGRPGHLRKTAVFVYILEKKDHVSVQIT